MIVVKKTWGKRWHIVASIDDGIGRKARTWCGRAMFLDSPATESMGLAAGQSAGVHCQDCVKRGPRA